jgi:hypothetical protein
MSLSLDEIAGRALGPLPAKEGIKALLRKEVFPFFNIKSLRAEVV